LAALPPLDLARAALSIVEGRRRSAWETAWPEAQSLKPKSKKPDAISHVGAFFLD